MAVSQGTATNFVDFYNKLRDFLTTNSTLVSLGQNWTQIAGNTGTLTIDDTITVRGPGLSGADQIRVRLKPVYSVVDNRYNLELVGVPNWNPALDQESQFNMSAPVYIHLWNSSMPYTFVASGRRFVAVAQVTSVVQACYAGFILPYALPAEYPYPMAIGGSSNVSTFNYAQSSNDHCHFVNPSNSLRVYTPGNTWVSGFNRNASGVFQEPGCIVAPYQSPVNSANFRSSWANLRECFGGKYPLHPLILITASPTVARLGVLDGCFHVPGIGNSQGTMLTVNTANDHMVVQNVNRTDNWLGYWALRMD